MTIHFFEAFASEYEEFLKDVVAIDIARDNMTRAYVKYMHEAAEFHARCDNCTNSQFFAWYDSIKRYEREYEQARDEFYILYNSANQGPDFPVETQSELKGRCVSDFDPIDYNNFSEYADMVE